MAACQNIKYDKIPPPGDPRTLTLPLPLRMTILMCVCTHFHYARDCYATVYARDVDYNIITKLSYNSTEVGCILRRRGISGIRCSQIKTYKKIIRSTSSADCSSFSFRYHFVLVSMSSHVSKVKRC